MALTKRLPAAKRGYKMVNLIEHGKTPILPLAELAAMGYKIAVYPLTLLNVSIKTMRDALMGLRDEQSPSVLSFNKLTEVVGFADYYVEETRYKP